MDPENPVPGVGIYTGLVNGYPNVVFRISYRDEEEFQLNVLRKSTNKVWWFNVETGFFDTFTSSARLSNEVIAGLGLTGFLAGVNVTTPVTRTDVTYKGIPVSE